MTLRYYGSLRKLVTPPEDFQIQISITVEDLMKRLDIPPSAVKLVMVNHAPVQPSSVVGPDASVAFFPKEYPFFADWKDYRLE